MPKEKRLLLLFDGNALVHRAFHALPPLTVPKTGEMVGAVYGFASMLLKVLSEIKPTHYAIAFDRPTPTFRHHRFEEYKAQRPATPDELTGQYQRLRELIEAFHIPVFEMEGYEADDILGSLSRQASVQNIDTIIVTGDADAMQLVSPKVQVLMPRRAFGDTMLYDKAAVGQKYGVEPRQIADLKALEGDSSDNIPGVPGIGPKTAARLIQQFGSVEGVYTHVDEVTPTKLGQTLRANQELALLSKELATIVTEVPVELELDACQVSAHDRSRVVELFRALEFASLIPKLPETETTPQGDYRVIDTIPALDELVARLARTRSFVIDVETTAKEAMQAQLVGIALSAAPSEAYYVPLGHIGWQELRHLPLPQAIDRLKPLLEDPRIAKIAHNGNYDMSVLAQYGVKLQNLSFDTMIAAHLLGEKSLGLKALAFSKLGIEMTPLTALIGSGAKKISMAAVDIGEAAQYACADADLTLRLRELLEAELHEQGLWKLFAEVEMPLVPVLVLMQQHGVAIDTGLLRRMSQSLGRQILQLEIDIYDSVGHRFNISSTQQLGTILFDELGLPRARKTKSGYSTEASVLEALRGRHPVVEQVLEYRQLMKLKSTYIDALPGLTNPKTGRVHTSFRQTGTTTGRLSSSDPNLQNIPIRSELGRQIRHAFIAPSPAVLLAADSGPLPHGFLPSG
jgi:DNA polymerase-1